jgi:hypothetical protein
MAAGRTLEQAGRMAAGSKDGGKFNCKAGTKDGSRQNCRAGRKDGGRQ